MSYQVKIPVYEGPMDLLLHLIDKNEVDIYNIPIALITEHYLEYLSLAEEIDLELTSEFLLMACTLLSIKARMLLPKRVMEPDEDNEEDPRQDLVEKLLEYKQYKDKANIFKEIEKEQSRYFWREVDEVSLLKEFPPLDPIGDLSMEQLITAFRQVLSKQEQKNIIIPIAREEITIQDKMLIILQELQRNPGGLSFFRLFSNLTSREEIIVTFLAMLELVRRDSILIVQNSLFADIHILFKEKEEGQDSANPVS